MRPPTYQTLKEVALLLLDVDVTGLEPQAWSLSSAIGGCPSSTSVGRGPQRPFEITALCDLIGSGISWTGPLR